MESPSSPCRDNTVPSPIQGYAVPEWVRTLCAQFSAAGKVSAAPAQSPATSERGQKPPGPRQQAVVLGGRVLRAQWGNAVVFVCIFLRTNEVAFLLLGHLFSSSMRCFCPEVAPRPEFPSGFLYPCRDTEQPLSVEV
jgi:hypothetical protein